MTISFEGRDTRAHDGDPIEVERWEPESPPEAESPPPEAESPPEAAAEPARAPATTEENLLEALPALARLAAEAWLHAARWGVNTTARAGGRLARAATDPDAAAELIGEVSDGLRAYAREFLGISDLDDRVKRLAPGSAVEVGQRVRTDELLRAQGTELLRHAADVHFDGEAHPAYGRILTEIVPDEGRILRMLAVEGPQPSVDVRAGNLIGVGSQLVAPGLNMIGAQAGLRHRDRVPAYLQNLFRLGLVAFSDAPVENPIAYQVLEAQPDVMAAIKETTRAKTVQRSIALTAFGEDFCRVCLPLDGLPADEAPAALPSGD